MLFSLMAALIALMTRAVGTRAGAIQNPQVDQARIGGNAPKGPLNKPSQSNWLRCPPMIPATWVPCPYWSEDPVSLGTKLWL